MFTLPFVIHIANYCSYPICSYHMCKQLFTIRIPCSHYHSSFISRIIVHIPYVLNHYLPFISHMFTLPFVIHIANYCSYPICSHHMCKQLFTIRIPCSHYHSSYRELLFISHMVHNHIFTVIIHITAHWCWECCNFAIDQWLYPPSNNEATFHSTIGANI